MGAPIEYLLSLIHKLDVNLFFAINHTRSPLLDVFMVHLSDFKFFLPFIIVFILYRLIKGSAKERIMWIVGILAVVTSDALCARVLKPLIGRMRPYVDLDHVFLYKSGKWILTNPEFRIGVKNSLSWPSCHSTNMWTAAFFIYGWNKTYSIPIFMLAFLVSYSRIYLGVHYPLDCLGGFLVGFIWGSILVFVAKKVIDLYEKG